MTDQFEYDVFLSFSSADEEIVRPVWQELCSNGLRVFWSDSTLKKEVGNSWFDVIEKSLERSKHMLLVCSENSVESKWVQREYRAFLEHCYSPGKRRLIPVLTRDFKAGSLPIFLREFQVGKLDDPNFIQQMIPLLGGVNIEQLQKEVQLLKDQISAVSSENVSLRNSLKDDMVRVNKLAQESLDAVQKLDTVTNNIERKVSAMEGYYPTHTEAFMAMTKCIQDQILNCKENGVPEPVIELRHISVAMSFSWYDFVTTQVPKLLSAPETKSATLAIQAAFVDRVALKGLSDPAGIEWPTKSVDKVRDIPQFKESMSSKFGDHFSFEYKTYYNLPQWHGWLISTTVNEKKYQHLFMGRTKWIYNEKNPDEYPRMTVGHNEYRYYTERALEGLERIDLFEQWHRYLFCFDTPLEMEINRHQQKPS